MKHATKPLLATSAALLIFLAVLVRQSAAGPVPLPRPAVDESSSAAKGRETAVFAGGCFWGIQDVFEHVKGVKNTTAGYAGGTIKNPSYEEAETGTTGYAESVEVTYDPSQVTYGQLLQVFFSVAMDPTELNRQGPDEGTQYRSALFFETPDQERIAKAYVGQLSELKAFSGPIVTQVVPFTGFHAAEDYHQDFATRNPDNPYIVINDLPKVANLKKEFPELYH
ncbi:MAG TPA: peptide-methionine (S)-S-oxide reductase MsrA [Candidatus Aquilonibacter sp.]|nr:peptide-methionine (S)-S-oxide reductase MsrA [Candidatus Aquilonibacter sp.]